ncbi:MAG: hypothetical protein ACPHZB_01515, partial [Flavobacteriales bacterium]
MSPSQASPHEQQAAIQSGGEAARVLLKALPKGDEELSISEKADGSLVSSADLASQRAIQDCLQGTDVPVLSEEAAAPPFEE